MSREFQVFIKPAGARCNLACHYCYYLSKEQLYAAEKEHRMPQDVLETFIVQHIAAGDDPTIYFSWHGGEPTLLGLDFYRTVVALQCKHLPPGRRIGNGIQTNGTLLDETWCRFFAAEGFTVGVSIDGPQDLHDLHRLTRGGKSTFEQTLRGLALLRQHHVPFEILCVVNADNVRQPLRVYRFFKELGAQYISFLPLVEWLPGKREAVSECTVPAEAFGDFLCAIFDEWVAQDIGKVKVQIFEEAARPAFGQEHTLCIFRRTCGGVPVVEHNGDFYACDHFVDEAHRIGNIMEHSLAQLLDSPAQLAFGHAKQDALPRYCRTCPVLDMCNGECPKNRFITTPDNETGLNYLCAGYKRFFTHCRPFVEQIAALWRQQTGVRAHPPNPSDTARSKVKVGRNDPCPCGSGKKAKHCCMAS